MGYIKVNQSKVDDAIAKTLKKLCPFNAFEYEDKYLSINAACKVCKICVNKGPQGICEYVEEQQVSIDKSQYKGITVYIEQLDNEAHPVAYELIGKAKELAKKTKEPVYAVVIGNDIKKIAEEALTYGVDKVFAYQDEQFKTFNVEHYTNVLEHFFKTVQNNIFLLGGTPQGRSFAPRIAARLKTGLTADCTMLDIKENGDLLQIRPAFGGNIMAKINTPNHRPQLATIRYKMFNKPEKVTPHGTISYEPTHPFKKASNIEHIETIKEPPSLDISDAEVIIAVGRAFKKKEDLTLIEPLRKKLNAMVACTRPLIENGWFDAKRQIGLSGRTVKPKLIINLGVSGAVQYIEGMKDSELIISINEDKDNKLFNISHYSIVGDIYELLPKINDLVEAVQKENSHV